MQLGGKVTIKTGSPVTRIHTENNLITSLSCGKNSYTAHYYIFATGGVSHPETGSTGDGFKWLTDLGHNIAEPTPSIVPLATHEENWSHELAGVSLVFYEDYFFCRWQERHFQKQAKYFLRTFGLSGPLNFKSWRQKYRIYAVRWASDGKNRCISRYRSRCIG
jgi:predicted flavoprotein YhiN